MYDNSSSLCSISSKIRCFSCRKNWISSTSCFVLSNCMFWLWTEFTFLRVGSSGGFLVNTVMMLWFHERWEVLGFSRRILLHWISFAFVSVWKYFQYTRYGMPHFHAFVSFQWIERNVLLEQCSILPPAVNSYATRGHSSVSCFKKNSLLKPRVGYCIDENGASNCPRCIAVLVCNTRNQISSVLANLTP